MSSDIAIRVESLSKKYTISHKGNTDGGLRHAIQNVISAPWRAISGRFCGGEKLTNGSIDFAEDQTTSAADSAVIRPSPGLTPTTEDFWALRDVDFEVKRGEVVGIIGRNGAGKSTLLKVLSRITEPTQGRITIEGRVASLLEVGTGFHPELTGRENVYLNGAILGMTRAEVRRKFDEIVAFAEVDRFLDTPVKRYSSGMYVRLAFAVAAHLEPEILIVDEVLAVGDAQFQKKCLGKMREASVSEGRTVIFVSHNLAAVSSLCSSGLLLEGGRTAHRGSIATTIDRYLSPSPESNFRTFGSSLSSPIGMDHFSAGNAGEGGLWDCSCPLPITICYSVLKRVKNLEITIRLERAGTFLGTCFVSEYSGVVLPVTPGRFQVDVELAPISLLNDLYQVHVWFGDPHKEFYVEYPLALTLTVINRRHDPTRTAEAAALGPLMLAPGAPPSVRSLVEETPHPNAGNPVITA